MNYSYLKSENAPKILVEAYKLLGIREVLGKDNNPIILKWADKVGLKKQYTADSIPWCGLFMAYVCHQAGKEIVTEPLWARNWLGYGTAQRVAMLGDVLVFKRDMGGHVGIYVGEDDKCYHVLGGNQGDAVSIVAIRKERCIGIRRTEWTIKQPENVRVIKLNKATNISENEV